MLCDIMKLKHFLLCRKMFAILDMEETCEEIGLLGFMLLSSYDAFNSSNFFDVKHF